MRRLLLVLVAAAMCSGSAYAAPSSTRVWQQLSVSIANVNIGTADSSCIGGGFTVPANMIGTAGSELVFECWGLYTTPATNTGTLTLKVKTNGSAILTGSAVTMPSSVTNGWWHARETCTFRVVGSSGALQCNGRLDYDDGAGGLKTSALNGLATVNTATAESFDFALLWSTTAGGQSATANQGTLSAAIR